MNIAGYLVIISNLQHMLKLDVPIQDISFHISSLDELTLNLNNLEFPIEGYRNNGFQKQGNLAIYASKNLREYIFNGKGTGSDEGIILKLHYGSSLDGGEEKYDALSYFIRGEDLDDAAEKEVSERMMQTAMGRRIKRSVLDKLIP